MAGKGKGNYNGCLVAGDPPGDADQSERDTGFTGLFHPWVRCYGFLLCSLAFRVMHRTAPHYLRDRVTIHDARSVTLAQYLSPSMSC